ncbi:branched-chain amino acid ABC transporter permease [Phaeobacter italicus]|jgi:branched-chain amino acid transport system permease protein|uniref:branched-chain amino acid ABC transporter permease n=1 Tax=Phaeobacter italicus TaxID=481446 RepID=UPI002FDA2A7C
MDYFIYSLTLMAIYVGLAQLLYVQFGLLGIPNFGIVGFWGAGMYLTGVFVVTLKLPLGVSIVLATAIVGCVGWGIGRMVLRRSGQAILCATLAFSAVIATLVISEKWLTKGVQGLGTIHYPFEVFEQTELLFGAIVLTIVIGLVWGTIRLRDSRLGRVMIAVRDNEELAESLGKNTFSVKNVTFAATCGGMALLGGLSAPLNQFLVPYLLSPAVTFTIWIALVLGGKSHSFGGLVGVLLTFGLFNILIETYAPVPVEYAGMIPNLKMFCYGLLLVVVIMFRPSGVLGTSTPKKDVRPNPAPRKEHV